jgi:hypothetical protein
MLEYKCRCHPNFCFTQSSQSCADAAISLTQMHTPNPVLSQKRHHSDVPDLHETQQERKKQKVNHPTGSQPPSVFWDNLSKVWLTRNALRELDRRNNQAARSAHKQRQRQVLKPLTRAALAKWKKENLQTIQPAVDFLNCCTSRCLKDIQEFARLGGPDLSELRGVSL